MRDATGKLTDALHLLGLAQLLFELFLRGDIPKQSQQQRRMSIQAHQRAGIFNREDLAVAKCDPSFDELINNPVLESLLVPLEHFIRLFRVGVNHREWLAFQLVTAHADQFAKGFIDGHDEAILIGDPHAIDRIFPN